MSYSVMNLALYLRKSRSDPEDESMEETLSRHKKTLLQFAETNKLNVIAVYEEVVSGDGLFVRPEMIKLMNDIEENKYDGVLCMDIDRLGRVDTKDRGIILDTFKSNNTKIVTPRKIYDLNDELDEFSTEIQMLFARQELKKITQRMQQGVRRSVEDGYHVGEPPYGYRRTYIDKRPTLEIHEEEASIIRFVFDMYVNQGVGSCIIADRINAMGYKTRKGTRFSRNTIRFFLQNQTYIGKIIWNKQHHKKKKNPADKHRMIPNPESEWIVSDGVHPAIIDEETFQKAQEIRKTRSHPPSNTGEIKNPYAGLIRCKNCGQLMSRQTSSKTGPRLLCTNNACTKSTILAKVEKIVLTQLKMYLFEFKAELKKMEENDIPKTTTQLAADIINIKKQLTTLSKQKERLHDLLEQGIYDIPTFTERSKKLSLSISTLNKMLADKQNELNSNHPLSLRDFVIPTLQQLTDNYYDLGAGEKNTLMKKILKTIYYRRDASTGNDIEISILFKDWL